MLSILVMLMLLIVKRQVLYEKNLLKDSKLLLILLFRKPTRPPLPLKKEIFLKSPRPSLPLKRAPPLTPPLSPSGGEGGNRPTRCSEPLRSKVGGPSKVSPDCAGWDRLGATCLRAADGLADGAADGLAPIQVLVNVDIFSEGFDCPDVEFVCSWLDQRCHLPSTCRWWDVDCE